jgi:hypothetical protein
VTRALLVLAVALWPAVAGGAALTLDERGRREALRVGETSVGNDGFDAEWRITNGRGESVSVLTPFHRLVVAARHATFSGKPLKPSEPEKLLKEQRDRLVLMLELRGGKEDFARSYMPRLIVGDREIKPTFVQNERTASRQQDGQYLARCVYGFPTRDVDGSGRAALIVADGEGRDVSRFAIDLGKMR